MPNLFYAGQTDYISKLNLLASDFTNTSIPANVSGTTTLNCSLSSNFYITMGAGDTTLAFSNVPEGAFKLVILVKKDNSGTTRTINWPGSVHWQSGDSHLLTTTANQITIYELISVDSGTVFFGRTFGTNYTA